MVALEWSVSRGAWTLSRLFSAAFMLAAYRLLPPDPPLVTEPTSRKRRRRKEDRLIQQDILRLGMGSMLAHQVLQQPGVAFLRPIVLAARLVLAMVPAVHIGTQLVACFRKPYVACPDCCDLEEVPVRKAVDTRGIVAIKRSLPPEIWRRILAWSIASAIHPLERQRLRHRLQRVCRRFNEDLKRAKSHCTAFQLPRGSEPGLISFPASVLDSTQHLYLDVPICTCCCAALHLLRVLLAFTHVTELTLNLRPTRCCKVNLQDDAPNPPKHVQTNQGDSGMTVQEWNLHQMWGEAELQAFWSKLKVLRLSCLVPTSSTFLFLLLHACTHLEELHVDCIRSRQFIPQNATNNLTWQSHAPHPFRLQRLSLASTIDGHLVNRLLRATDTSIEVSFWHPHWGWPQSSCVPIDNVAFSKIGSLSVARLTSQVLARCLLSEGQLRLVECRYYDLDDALEKEATWTTIRPMSPLTLRLGLADKDPTSREALIAWLATPAATKPSKLEVIAEHGWSGESKSVLEEVATRSDVRIKWIDQLPGPQNLELL